MQEFEVIFLLRSGLLQGVWKHIAIGDLEQVRIDLLSEEAIKTSSIEGEFLDRSSVQSSVMRQFGVVSDHRVEPTSPDPCPQEPELLLVGAQQLNNLWFVWR